jgi:hypothetical protein
MRGAKKKEKTVSARVDKISLCFPPKKKDFDFFMFRNIASILGENKKTTDAASIIIEGTSICAIVPSAKCPL